MIEVYYLAYGSNLHPDRLHARVGQCRKVANIKLPNYSLVFNKRSCDGSAKCSLSSDEEKTAYGVLYAVTNQQMLTLDGFEGGSGYFKTQWPCKVGDQVYAAQLYMVSHAHITMLPPYDWYVEYVVRGAQFHAFPTNYVQYLKSINAVKDNDAVRAAAEWNAANALSTAPQASTTWGVGL